ncbi:MAG: hypothetical protein ACI36Y_08090 [Coriobacteriales bacterium]
MPRGALLRLLKCGARLAGAAVLAAALALGAAGCKTTDFFTEILISPDAAEVDEHNPDKITVNSPDAAEESGDLAALKWSEESASSEDVQNLVVWSMEPNTALFTHHSLYALQPRFPGIQASDGVRLVFNADAALDHSVDNATGESNDAMSSVSAGTSGQTVNVASPQAGEGSDAEATGGAASVGIATGGLGQALQAGAGQQSEEAGEDAGEDSSGGDDAGEGEGEGESSDPSDDEGDTSSKYAGYGGSLTVYDPHNIKQEIPQADSIAVIGKRAAVVVQAIGGKGAICAMSKQAYSKREGGEAMSFKEVFGAECPERVVTWDSDDSSIKDVDPAALVERLQGRTLILYDQDLCGGSTDPNEYFFTDEQLKELYAAGVVGFAPLSLNTEYGIVDAAYFTGEALAASTALKSGWDSRAMAERYVEAVDSIIRGVIACNPKGSWVYGNEASAKKSTELKGSAAKVAGSSTYVHTIIATDAQRALSYTGDKGQVDASDIVLFAGYGQNKYSPLGFWMQAAGVADTLFNQNSASGSGDAASSPSLLTLLWGTDSSVTKKNLKGSGGAYANWHGTVSNMAISGVGTGADSLGKVFGGGLGSQNMPYLIVSGSKDGKLGGSEVKRAVVASIESSGHYTPYTAFEYAGAVAEALAPYDSSVVSHIGDTNFRKAENPFKSGLSAADAVRVNPCGLLESWTSGSFESVLECAWLACIYSSSPEGCAYEAAYDWTQFEATVGEKTISGSAYNGDPKQTLRALVEEFYSAFYRCKVDYGAVVTDEGL